MTIGPELDIFERFGMQLSDQQKLDILNIADAALISSCGRYGLVELLYFLSRQPRNIVASIEVPGSPFQ